MSCLYKDVNKTKSVWRYMDSIELQTEAPTVHREDSTSCIYVVEAKRVTHRFMNIESKLFFLQEKYDNGLFIPKYDKYTIMPDDMCVKSLYGTIINRSIMTRF